MKNMEIIIRTFHNGNYDKVFVNSLSLDLNKILPDEPSQASYDNKPDNWVVRNRWTREGEGAATKLHRLSAA